MSLEDKTNSLHEISINEIRKLCIQFAANRDWFQFHTPRNFLLALMGEVGELVEALDQNDNSSNSIRNIEEEIADVFLYLIQFCGCCKIDFSGIAMRSFCPDFANFQIDDQSDCSVSWGFDQHITLSQLQKFVECNQPINQVVNVMIRQITQVCSLFSWKNALSPALLEVKAEERQKLTNFIVEFAMQMFQISNFYNFNMTEIILQKMEKNALKYKILNK